MNIHCNFSIDVLRCGLTKLIAASDMLHQNPNRISVSSPRLPPSGYLGLEADAPLGHLKNGRALRNCEVICEFPNAVISEQCDSNAIFRIY